MYNLILLFLNDLDPLNSITFTQLNPFQ